MSERDHQDDPLLPRRGLLRLALGASVAAGLSACSGGHPAPDPTGSGAPVQPSTIPSTLSPPTPSTRALPAQPDYRVLPQEVAPVCKQTAVRTLEALFTGDSFEPAALDARLARIGQPAGIGAALRFLLPDGGPGALRVVYPQYGGIAGPRASVMVTAQRLTPDPAGPVSTPVTVDVRLLRASGGWRVTDLRPSLAPGRARPLSATARELLAASRVRLDGVSRDDVSSGLVDDRVLRALLEMSKRWELDVQVVISGHPYDVFGADHVSNHVHGRAADVRALNGVPVIEHGRSAWRAAMRTAAAAGATEIGGPQALDGPHVAPFFTDQTHQDHVHVGFDT